MEKKTFICVCGGIWISVDGKPHHCPQCGTEDDIMINAVCDPKYAPKPDWPLVCLVIILFSSMFLYGAPVPRAKPKDPVKSMDISPGIWVAKWSMGSWETLFEVDGKYEAWVTGEAGSPTNVYKGTWSWDSKKRVLKISEAAVRIDGTLGEYSDYLTEYDENPNYVRGDMIEVKKPKPDF